MVADPAAAAAAVADEGRRSAQHPGMCCWVGLAVAHRPEMGLHGHARGQDHHLQMPSSCLCLHRKAKNVWIDSLEMLPCDSDRGCYRREAKGAHHQSHSRGHMCTTLLHPASTHSKLRAALLRVAQPVGLLSGWHTSLPGSKAGQTAPGGH